MAAPKLGFFEKIANMSGVIYRHHATQFPRRWDIFKKVLEREVRPPRMSEWPAIQKEFKAVVKYIEGKEYKSLSVREAAVYVAVGIEVLCWFFVGEMIGRRNATGYLVPGSYVSKETRKKAAEQKMADPHSL